MDGAKCAWGYHRRLGANITLKSQQRAHLRPASRHAATRLTNVAQLLKRHTCVSVTGQQTTLEAHGQFTSRTRRQPCELRVSNLSQTDYRPPTEEARGVAVKGCCIWLDTLDPWQQVPGGQHF